MNILQSFVFTLHYRIPVHLKASVESKVIRKEFCSLVGKLVSPKEYGNDRTSALEDWRDVWVLFTVYST